MHGLRDVFPRGGEEVPAERGLRRVPDRVDYAVQAIDVHEGLESTLVILRSKLKDGIGQYLWQAGLQANQPDKLLGEPLTVNQDMDSTIASGKKTLLYGKLDQFKIRRVRGLRLYRLEERYRDNDQDAFLAFIREDANLLTAEDWYAVYQEMKTTDFQDELLPAIRSAPRIDPRALAMANSRAEKSSDDWHYVA